jgi:predicted  nucleic acid-binding Zn-ribbon protein
MKIQNNQLIREVVISINEIQEMEKERANLERQKAKLQEHIDRIDFELAEFEKLPKKEIAKIEKAEKAQEKPLEIVEK